MNSNMKMITKTKIIIMILITIIVSDSEIAT